MSQSPDVRLSIGLPVFNGGEYLDETLTSLRASDIDGLEIVVGDNGSTDDTPSIIEQHASEDDRIVTFRVDENRGAAWNFNEVLRRSNGDFFHWAGHDDLVDPAMLAKCVGALEATDGAVLAYPRTMLIDEAGTPTGEYDNRLKLSALRPSDRLRSYLRNIRLANPIFGVIPKETLLRVGGLGDFASADLVTLARLALLGKFVEVDEILFYRRMHAAQSWQASGGYEGFAEWFNPAFKGRVVFANWRLFRELLTSCFKFSLPPGQALRSACVVAVEFPRRRWRRMIGDITRLRVVLRKRFAKGD